MAFYKYEVTLDSIFIRKVTVTAYAIKRANQLAIYELKQLYPNTYNDLKIELIYCSEPEAACNKKI